MSTQVKNVCASSIGYNKLEKRMPENYFLILFIYLIREILNLQWKDHRHLSNIDCLTPAFFASVVL